MTETGRRAAGLLHDATPRCRRPDALRRLLPVLDADELFLGDGLELVLTVTAGRSARSRSAPRATLARRCVERHDPTTGSRRTAGRRAVARPDGRGRRRGGHSTPAGGPTCGGYREAQTEAITTLGAPHKLDVTLPAADARRPFLDECPASWSRSIAPDARTWLFGHAADGNVHVNVTGLDPDDESVDDAVLALVAERGGSITAEHGIGTAKRPVAAPQPLAGGDRRHAGDQVRPSTRRDPQPRRPARAARLSAPGAVTPSGDPLAAVARARRGAPPAGRS